MTAIAITPPVERIARILCAQNYSEKGQGIGSGRGAAISAAVSSHCDHGWREETVRAAEVLRTLREPTEEMVKAGEAAKGGAADTWDAMVRAALGENG